MAAGRCPSRTSPRSSSSGATTCSRGSSPTRTACPSSPSGTRPSPRRLRRCGCANDLDFDRREDEGIIRDVDRDDERGYDAQTAYLRNALGAKHVPKGAPAYKGYVKTRLGANNVATLEKVYASDTHPSDDMVESVRRATKLPRSKIVAWFKTRREEDKMGEEGAVRERYGGEEEEDGF